MLYGLNDISIIPARITNINHRAECNPYNFDGMLPLFTAPMNSIVNETNYKVFLNNKINTIIPRGVDYKVRVELATKTFVAMGLTEFESFINDLKSKLTNPEDVYYVCIDIANGHMKRLIDLCAEAKSQFGGQLLLMAGNIANPETYLDYAKAGIDFIRLGIGGGSACFVAGTKVTMANGAKKNIEDIDIGEQVKTISGNQKVISTFKKQVNSTMIINNRIECTLDHKFLVINKKDKDKVTENNLSEYSFYIEAKNLTSDYLLVEDKIV